MSEFYTTVHRSVSSLVRACKCGKEYDCPLHLSNGVGQSGIKEEGGLAHDQVSKKQHDAQKTKYTNRGL